MQRRVVVQPDQRERVDDRLLLGDQRGQPLREFCRPRPVANGERGFGKAAEGIRVVRPECDRAIITCDRLGVALELVQRVAAVEQRLGVVRPQRQRPVEACQRLVVAHELLERAAAIVERLGIARPQRQRAVVARQRLLVALEALQRIAAVVVRLDEVRSASTWSKLASASSYRLSRCSALPRLLSASTKSGRSASLVAARERLVVAPQFAQDETLVRQRLRGPRVDLQRRVDEREGLEAAALLMANDAKQMLRIEVARLGF
jgi:hypothetical protein